LPAINALLLALAGLAGGHPGADWSVQEGGMQMPELVVDPCGRVGHVSNDAPRPSLGPKIQASATLLPFPDDVFDAAVAVNVLYHLAQPLAAIRGAHRVLRPGGLFVAAAPSRHDSP
jgi:SAM-dependent methyltransferase